MEIIKLDWLFFVSSLVKNFYQKYMILFSKVWLTLSTKDFFKSCNFKVGLFLIRTKMERKMYFINEGKRIRSYKREYANTIVVYWGSCQASLSVMKPNALNRKGIVGVSSTLVIDAELVGEVVLTYKAYNANTPPHEGILHVWNVRLYVWVVWFVCLRDFRNR